MRLLLVIPTISVGILILFLAIGLRDGNHNVHPSSLMNKPFPKFVALTLIDERPTDNAELVDRPRLVNVWASWCTACRDEHSIIEAIASNEAISVIGINYKDQRSDALDWLTELGNPFEYIIVDQDGRLGVDLGVYGAPETFLIDGSGIIRFKHVGALSNAVWKDEFLPLIEQFD